MQPFPSTFPPEIIGLIIAQFEKMILLHHFPDALSYPHPAVETLMALAEVHRSTKLYAEQSLVRTLRSTFETYPEMQIEMLKRREDLRGFVYCVGVEGEGEGDNIRYMARLLELCTNVRELEMSRGDMDATFSYCESIQIEFDRDLRLTLFDRIQSPIRSLD